MGRMKDISRSGRTLVFVSHNMSAICQVCDRAIMLEGGRLLAEGPTSQVVARYLERSQEAGIDPSLRRKSIYPVRIQIGESPGQYNAVMGAPFVVEVELEATEDREFSIALMVLDMSGTHVFWLHAFEREFVIRAGGRKTLRFSADRLPLFPGSYWIGLWIGRGVWMENYLDAHHVLRFEVLDNPEQPYFTNYQPLVIKSHLAFRIEESTV
jgi:lipopolysaccharide transport system ATP-binding protein